MLGLNNRAQVEGLDKSRIQNQLDTNELELNRKHKNMTQEVQTQAGKKLTQLKDRQTKQAKAVQEAESNRYTTRLAGRQKITERVRVLFTHPVVNIA